MKGIKESIIKNVAQDDKSVELAKKISDWVETQLYLEDYEYTIRPDFSIDIHPKYSSDLVIRCPEKVLPDFIKFNSFSKVKILHVQNFKVLGGLPKKFDGTVVYDSLQTKTLEGGFEEVTGQFTVRNCKNLTSMKGCPKCASIKLYNNDNLANINDIFKLNKVQVNPDLDLEFEN